MSLSPSKLLSRFLKFPSIRDVIEDPINFPTINADGVEKWKEMMVSVLSEGLHGDIINNLKVSAFDPFKDGIASEIVGEAKFEVACVVKAGKQEVKDQNDFMNSYSDMGLFPKILKEENHEDKCICLMENLSNYLSLHEFIFLGEADSTNEIEKFLNYYYGWLFEIYSHYKLNNIPILHDIYQKPRLINRIEEAKKKLNSSRKLIFDLDIDSLLTRRIEFEGKELTSFNELMTIIESKKEEIQKLAPLFSTFVHGDAHPANIMLMKQPPHYDIKFIDPNPSLKGNSDYLYDHGKMLHWLDMMGYAVLERKIKEQIFSIESEYNNGLLKVGFKWHTTRKINLKKINGFQTHALNVVRDNLSLLAEKFKDSYWEKRLDLSTASAYLGGLSRIEDSKYLALVFIRGLMYLNRFVKSL